MRGIFGFVDIHGFPGHNSALQQAARSLIRLSEPRGREATGLAVIRPDEVAVYRRPMAPARVLAHPEFQQFLDSTLPLEPPSAARAEVAFLGHCRLVTNGTQVPEANNQPVLHDRLIGVHNGIVTNVEGLLAGAPGRPQDRFDLDSEALFCRIAKDLATYGDLSNALRHTFRDLEGEASIGMFAREENEFVLATNTGCLYFAGASEDRVFVFASEAHILRSFLRLAPLASGNEQIRHRIVVRS